MRLLKHLTEAATAPQPTNQAAGIHRQSSTDAGKIARANRASTPEQNPKVVAIQSMVAAANSKTLDFYGRAVDQNGDPIAEVTVKAGVGLVINMTQSGGRYYSTQTDAAGKFSFVGIHGAGMGPFVLTKKGYFYDGRSTTSSRPDDYVPDPENPVIFTMWKLKGAEPMRAYSISTAIPCDGSPTRYDLLTGKRVSTGGDLVITLTRTPVNITRGTPFDWAATLQIDGGGMVPISGVYPYNAPAEGYQPAVSIAMPAKMKSWDSAFERSYYFAIENGKIYGRATVTIQADFQPPPTYLGLSILLNPSGSRNLEYDPARLVNP